MIGLVWLIFFVVIVGVLAYQRVGLHLWTASLFVYVLLLTVFRVAGVFGLSVADYSPPALLA